MRSRFDQFAKQMISAGYRLAGAVETDVEVSPDAWRPWIQPAKRTTDDQEFFMSTEDIVEAFIQQHRREAYEEGFAEGLEESRQQGWAEAILAVYAERLGPPPAEISAIVQQTHDRAVLVGWLKLVATATADEVLRAMKG